MKIITKFVIYLAIAIVALPAMILLSPVKAQAAIESAPVTQLTTSPKDPEENGWFTEVTLIKLKSNRESKTYFQWNNTEGGWTEFEQSFRAWKGINTLYYYSENRDGVKEAIKSQVIKVDYERPVALSVQADGHNGQIRLSWPESPNIVSYRISKDDDFLASVTAEPTFYIDPNVEVDQTYNYKLKAIDQAGLKSKSIKTSATVTAPLVKKEITPAIDEGMAVVALPKKVEAKAEKVEPTQETPVVTGEPSPVKNWNRLFVAISILIIAAGAAIAGYYGYEWWMARREPEKEPREKKTSNRW